MTFYVELLADDGTVTDAVDAHECRAEAVCEYPAVCEEHPGCVASATNPVYVFETPSGLTVAACRNGVDSDYSRLVER